MKRFLVSIVVIAILGVLGWRIYEKVEETKTEAGAGAGGRGGPASVAVEIAPVEKGTVREIAQFTGSLSPRSAFILAPKVGGRLEILTVDVGDLVQPGDMIARLEDAEYIQQVEQARAELAVAKAAVAESQSNVNVTQRELERTEILREKKMASESELDEIEAAYAAALAKQQVAAAEVNRRQAALKATEVRLSYTTISATWGEEDGARVVGERFVDEGEMLRANSPIVSILDNSVMTAEIDVIERDYPKVKIGQSATITTDGYPGVEFTGKVVRIAPMLKELSRQASVEIEIDNQDRRLKPGMFIRASIQFDQHEDVTVIPVSALVRREEIQGVFVADLDEKVADFVPVKVGITEGWKAEIIAPPLSGFVVTLGQHLLEDGGAISLPEQSVETGKGPGGGKGSGDSK